MRFFTSRNDERVCHFCNTNILHGEHYVLVYFPKARRSYFFHVVGDANDCFSTWSQELFVKKYMEWKQNLDPPVKRGRPPIYRNSKIAGQLLALRRYHRKAGNEASVLVVNQQLEELKL